MALDPLADQILDVWFGPDEASIHERSPRWYKRDAAFDTELADRFGAHLVPASAGRYHHWERDPGGALALTILLDQFPRNIYRGDARAFSFDAAARGVVDRALQAGHDRMLIPPQRAFFYLPLMHSEHLADHARALRCFEDLVAAARGGPWLSMVTGNLKYQRAHTRIVQRFGRYPHRNEVIGRDSSPEELAFLQEPGSSF